MKKPVYAALLFGVFFLFSSLKANAQTADLALEYVSLQMNLPTACDPIKVKFKLTNPSTQTVNLKTYTLKYWFSNDCSTKTLSAGSLNFPATSLPLSLAPGASTNLTANFSPNFQAGEAYSEVIFELVGTVQESSLDNNIACSAGQWGTIKTTSTIDLQATISDVMPLNPLFKEFTFNVTVKNMSANSFSMGQGAGSIKIDCAFLENGEGCQSSFTPNVMFKTISSSNASACFTVGQSRIYKMKYCCTPALNGLFKASAVYSGVRIDTDVSNNSACFDIAH